jgi:hypothetical protein
VVFAAALNIDKLEAALAWLKYRRERLMHFLVLVKGQLIWKNRTHDGIELYFLSWMSVQDSYRKQLACPADDHKARIFLP